MERLTVKWTDRVYDTFDTVDVVDNEYSKANYNKILTKLGEYEDAEEQGKLVKLPCKVGDVVYGINTDRNIVSALKIISTKIYSYAIYFDYQLIDGIYKNIVSFADIDFGKTVFLTKSEAEAKLKELKGGENE